MPTYLVKPREPTVLSHKEYHELSSTDLLLSWTVPNAHVVPEILDIERFNVALSKTLSNFPHIAGRLVRPNTPDTPWKIRLTNSGVPVSLTDSDADEIFPTDLTAQPPHLYAESLNVTGIVGTRGQSDEPLFRVTINRFAKLNFTSIGACYSHMLFDPPGFLMFFRHLSQLYQGLEPVDPPPYYEPKAIKFPEPSKPPPPTYRRYDLSATPPWEQPERKAMEFIAFRLTTLQLAEIRNYVTKRMGQSRITRVDVVIALLARCLSEVEPESKPIDTISYVVDHRGLGIYPVNAVVNAVVWLPVGLQAPEGFDPCDSVVAHAAEIRKSMEKLGDPGSIKDMAADLAKILSQVAWDKNGQDMANVNEGCLVANITWRMGLTSPHFGHPGKTSYHTNHTSCSRYVQIMTPNPEFVDGMWISREGEMEGTLYVPPNRRKIFETLFEGYAKGLGMTGSVEFLS